ncbi:MAG: 3-dehydroquinate synthase [Spirulina sp.]
MTPLTTNAAIASERSRLPIRQNFAVTFNYEVHFTRGLLQPDNPLLARVLSADREALPKSVLAIIDDGLLQHWPDLPAQLKQYVQTYREAIALKNEPILVPGGERAKTQPQWVEKIQQAIAKVGLCRHSYVLALGGGAVLDLAGYAAATAHRGIRLIRVPTTVLAQNDSGVGVKNSVNAFGKKNFLGTFAPPYAVLNDCNFLQTLSDRDWRAGMAEAVKVALIKDADFFAAIEQQAIALSDRDFTAMQALIYRCAQLHLNHIATSGDPFELGSSRPLDFGHWAAHQLEHLTDYRLRHGEAVAIGMALDSTYSYLTGLLSQPAWQRIIEVLEALGFTLLVPELNNPELFQGLTEFREHLGGQLTITLLKDIGKGTDVNEVDISLYRQAISLLQENAKILVSL